MERCCHLVSKVAKLVRHFSPFGQMNATILLTFNTIPLGNRHMQQEVLIIMFKVSSQCIF